MSTIKQMLKNNREWSERIRKENPGYLEAIAYDQKPEILWIGCSDSRVGPDQLIGLPMGSVFVHRNVANVFATNDLNCLAVLEYAIDELKVPNIVVCGHYGCGGVNAALEHSGVNPVDLWLDQVRFVYNRYAEELNQLPPRERANRLAERNVESQVHNICRNTIVRQAWKRGQEVNVIGVIYDIHDGLLKQLGIEFRSQKAWEARYGEVFSG
ncbi:MAG: carbonic anhydrase [Mariprofundus sp.]|nr:carbonic anhydrase [Mariprofundus sp.]